MNHLKLNADQTRVIEAVSRRYGAAPRGVAMLASVFGPDGWRGCVTIARDYKPMSNDAIPWDTWEELVNW